MIFNIDGTNPGNYIGGSWREIADGRFIVGAGNTYDAGTTGGRAEVKLTTNEMPRHQHGLTLRRSSGNTGDAGTFSAGNGTGSTSSYPTDWAGGGAPFSIIPPYFALHVWQRMA